MMMNTSPSSRHFVKHKSLYSLSFSETPSPVLPSTTFPTRMTVYAIPIETRANIVVQLLSAAEIDVIGGLVGI